jgi:hypothetical protein
MSFEVHRHDFSFAPGISGVPLGAQCATDRGFRSSGGVLLAFVPGPMTDKHDEALSLLG